MKWPIFWHNIAEMGMPGRTIRASTQAD